MYCIEPFITQKANTLDKWEKCYPPTFHLRLRDAKGQNVARMKEIISNGLNQGLKGCFSNGKMKTLHWVRIFDACVFGLFKGSLGNRILYRGIF